MHKKLHTQLCEALGCQYPIIQTAMGWVAEPQLVIASSNAGAFGFLGAAVMTPEETKEKIRQVRDGTDKNFGVNFHSFQSGARDIVETIIQNSDQIRAVSFGRGPDAEMIERFKNAGILCIPTVGAVRHAQKMQSLGVDMITAQGGEGGGHTGSVPTTILLPQVMDNVNIPVIAAGGFADGRGLAAALAYGAIGMAMGTRFLMTKESPIKEIAKGRYVEAGTSDIYVTTKLDGIPQRMVRTDMMDRIEKSGPFSKWLRAFESARFMKKKTGASWLDLISMARKMTIGGDVSLAQAMTAASMPTLIQKALIEGDIENGVMATGVVAGRINALPSCQELVDSIILEASARLEALS